MLHRLTTALLASTVSAAPLAAGAGEEKLPEPAPRHAFDPKSPAPSPETADAPAHQGPAPVLADGRPDLSVVHLAPGADGLWALGADYKARFTPHGFTFVPFLGSAAPRNFPLEVQLLAVSSAGAPLALDGAATPAVRDSSVVYERGGVTERYELAPRGVEQVFVIHELPRRGELVVTAAWRGDYLPQPQDSGVRFAGEHGEVHVSGVHVFDAAGRMLDLPLSVRGDVLDIRVPASFVAGAALPITIDPVFTTFSFDSSPIDLCAPHTAYDLASNSWRMACHRVFSASDADLWTVAHDSNGVAIPGSGAWIDITSERWSGVRLANNALSGRYLAVAEVGPVGARVIKGRTLTPTTSTLGASFTIDGGELGDKHSPVVGGDPVVVGPTYFCVAWQRDFTPTDRDVHARLVGGHGGTWGSTVMVDNSGGTLDERPAITASNGKPPYDSQEWMIVWQRSVSSGNHDIRAARIRWDGVLTQPAFTTSATPQAEQFPSVAGPLDFTGGPRRYLISYQVLASFNNFDIEVRAMQGTSVTAQMNLSVVQATAYANQIAPVVATDGYQFAVAYCEDIEGSPGVYDVFVDHVAVRTLSSQITQLVTHEPVSLDPAVETSPCIASAHGGGGVGSRSLVAWDVFRSSHRDVLGALVEGSKGVPVEPFCYGTPERCPCANFTNWLRGCANSYNPAGAALQRQSGHANLADDDLRLSVWGTPPTSSMIIFASANAAGAGTPFGDGLRCVLSPSKRTRVLYAVDSAAQYPETGDVPLSLLTPGMGGGDVRYYQVWYRDPNALCGGGAYNLTNALKVTWLP